MLAHYVSRIAIPGALTCHSRHAHAMKRFVLLALFLAGCSRPQPEERYGFVARRGRDTISVERVTRQGNQVTSDEVDRFPRVRERHTEITLSDSGRIERLVMDVRTPSDSTRSSSDGMRSPARLSPDSIVLRMYCFTCS